MQDPGTTMNEYLFSYGTLQKEEVQQRLFGRKLKAIAATLTGYRAVKIRLSAGQVLADAGQEYHLIALPGMAGDRIDGLVLELTEDELLLCDKYEPEEYTRMTVQLESGQQCWIYAAKSPSDMT